MANKEFIRKYCLERSAPTKTAKAIEKMLKLANQSYPLEHTKKKGIKTSDHQYYDFEIFCLTTQFADAYYYLGKLWMDMVLPVWQKEMKIKKHEQKKNK